MTDAIELAKESPMTRFSCGPFAVDLEEATFHCGGSDFRVHDRLPEAPGDSVFLGWTGITLSGKKITRVIELFSEKWTLYAGNQIEEMMENHPPEGFKIVAAVSSEGSIFGFHIGDMEFAANGKKFRLHRFTERFDSVKPVLERRAKTVHTGGLCSLVYFRNNTMSRKNSGEITERRHAYNIGYEKDGAFRTVEFD